MEDEKMPDNNEEIKKGDFVEVTNLGYHTTWPGTIGYVMSRQKQQMSNTEVVSILTYARLGFTRQDVEINDIKKIAEPTKRHRNYRVFINARNLETQFPSGSMHKTKEEIMLEKQMMFFSVEKAMLTGTKVVADWSPERSSNFKSAYKNQAYTIDGRQVFIWQVLCMDKYGKSCFETVSVYDAKMREFVNIPCEVLEPYEFDKNIFEKQLILDDTIKERIKTLVKRNDPQVKKIMEDDWKMKKMFTKGTGTIILCFGPPGTGKTLTAEAISEYVGKPLYIMSLNDIGGGEEGFESGLERTFRIVKRWNGILLFDEVDHFITSRDSPLSHSGMVSVMLRIIEYFDGIMIMTTNRPVDIDTAIDSRIHLKVYYPPLSGVEAQKIWKGHIPSEVPIVGKMDWDKLSRFGFNGREIKTVVYNVVSTAIANGLKEVPAKMFIEEANYFKNGKECLDSLRSKRKDKAHNPYDESASYFG